MKPDEIPEGMKVLNYARSAAKIPGAAAIPTLNEAAFKALSEGDTDPYFKVEAIDYPAAGSMGIYEGGFFESYINITKDRPIPGSKRGHEFSGRPSSDFYTVGGKLEPNADGKSGTAFLKIYIPPMGDTTDNAGFIRDARAGIVHFSIVTKPDYVAQRDALGQQVLHFTASKGAERNDAVEYGGGAMAQVVNADGADQQDGIPTITIGRSQGKKPGVIVEYYDQPATREIPHVEVRGSNFGDGIPTITIGGTK